MAIRGPERRLAQLKLTNEQTDRILELQREFKEKTDPLKNQIAKLDAGLVKARWELLTDQQRKTLRQMFADPVLGPPATVSANGAIGDGSPGLEPHPVCRAVAFFVTCRQSMAGRQEHFAPLTRNRLRRGMNEQASAWISAVDGLAEVHSRLRRVVVLNRDALDVIRSQDGPQTLFYLDPPYLQQTRSAPEVYAHELTAEGHLQLLKTIRKVQGRFLLSGYPNKLYAAAEQKFGWRRVELELPNIAAGGASKRRIIECIWMNF